MTIEPENDQEATALAEAALTHLSAREFIDLIGVDRVLENIAPDVIVKHVGADALLDAIGERYARKHFGIVE